LPARRSTLSGAFQELYSPLGRGSIPPERLMRALLLQAFYSIRSERRLVERQHRLAQQPCGPSGRLPRRPV
jgi:transposase